MSSVFNAQDHQWMTRAIQLARQGLYTTDPNPRVGCVIVRDGEKVGEGAHLKAGEPHAEVHALRAAGDKARGATAYVTLEPCSHHGKTPPCAEALVKAGVSRVICAMQDPNPLVAGRGLVRLQEAGIETASGLLESEARALNPGFISRMERGRPYTRLKLASSLDGRTAMQSGESQWITGAAARADVQRLRARSSAVLTGVDTVLIDNASLTVRAAELGLPPEQAALAAERQPMRVVVDSQLRLPASTAMLSLPGSTLVATTRAENEPAAIALSATGARVLSLPSADGRVDLAALLPWLAEHEQCNELLIECGATLAGAALRAGLVDELVLYMAPTLLGSSARPLFNLPLDQMAQQYRLQLTDTRQLGDDLRLTLSCREETD
ncbi:bifunctional diaminohydroxyphosphoribosylaminopyrimidine deaminase/5-amino-6-(5-phosphoribosylamino)uracil reductase RibD [Marinobacterium sediminicola]|uniref:Riboflavin biosynthesis protein RibD n=1 Tax=Marinobacterium sediminicola TaxID=518898 RepID=A0ABY1S2N5_9GAMM|nr:bifunctional diaminohydroxyphosphoribosylaminopyrimidine deaminase/5-amino-6-(5-phosphoribosylamino)uracil reductase RibD [Marinobacterium sediminicola]ULG69548.1 bifunctional diaminohydroxyphosphoribosylaminopyrimidine deaminase/5-amino-6-(5-phosphoribosylamino)uracil reductase RibD [Marinobacterium sediminicola]SMR75700.1 diaminohydroxyphosphoribosylaminopyrimidine deaminase [Marinobacterium sediminicola]